ncbi:hypothetical protein SAMN05444336_101101 [Albimonas donghaensis]|uniref:Uncharacterized protein n=1 Tax=Albimonas donghaensis TaxID=356660 RepID=A0A1H2QN34_9RHOB|nr:hypothetical protein [Albimonas donghaensis]SDW08541.1 hypothetical protein SAMN05444336_101101 [Albimonas donghaensis]
MSGAASARRDVLAFGIIRGASSVVSFFGAFYLIGIGEAKSYGLYLAGFSLAVIINVFTRFGADHTMLRLSRTAGLAGGREGASLRARVFKTWIVLWAPCMAAATAAWAAGAPYGIAIFSGVLISAAVVAGRYLRACLRTRPAPLYEPPFMHLFGVGLLCLGATPEMALGLGAGLWVALCAAIFVRTMGRAAPGRILRAPVFLRMRPGRLGSVYFSYSMEAAFTNGINLLIQALYGPVALAVFNTIMKLNFVTEQSQQFQRIFRVGTGRGGAAKPGAAAEKTEARAGGGGLKGRIKAFLNKLDRGRRDIGSGPVEIAFFSIASAVGNLAIMILLLRHNFTTVPPELFYVLLVILQTLSLAAGPAMFAILLFRSLVVANLLRIAFIASFVVFLLVAPDAPELWALGNIGLLAIVRYVALWYWKRSAPKAGAAEAKPASRD